MVRNNMPFTEVPILRVELYVKKENENQTHLGMPLKHYVCFIHSTPSTVLCMEDNYEQNKITVDQNLTILLLPHFPSTKHSLH